MSCKGGRLANWGLEIFLVSVKDPESGNFSERYEFLSDECTGLGEAAAAFVPPPGFGDDGGDGLNGTAEASAAADAAAAALTHVMAEGALGEAAPEPDDDDGRPGGSAVRTKTVCVSLCSDSQCSVCLRRCQHDVFGDDVAQKMSPPFRLGGVNATVSIAYDERKVTFPNICVNSGRRKRETVSWAALGCLTALTLFAAIAGVAYLWRRWGPPRPS